MPFAAENYQWGNDLVTIIRLVCGGGNTLQYCVIYWMFVSDGLLFVSKIN
jgi:hypothetical protein